MFKTTKPRKEVNVGSIMRFLNAVLASGEWFPSLTAEKQDTYARVEYSEAGVMSFWAVSKRKKVNKHASPVVRLSVTLKRHGTLPLFLVVEFDVNASGYVSGNELLGHYGKRSAHTFDSTSDFKDTDVSACWTVSCAKDLEALFRAYDSLAKIHGSPTIFNLP